MFCLAEALVIHSRQVFVIWPLWNGNKLRREYQILNLVINVELSVEAAGGTETNSITVWTGALL